MSVSVGNGGSDRWSADFVVVGSGGAGLAGALTAAILGLKVVVLEKTGLLGGTTAVSGGTSWIPNNSHEANIGVSDSREEALEYLRACIVDTGDPEHIEALVDVGREAIDFFESRAVNVG